MMRVCVPSYGRAATITTHRYLLPHVPTSHLHILLHNTEEHRWYRQNTSIPPECLIVTGLPLRNSLQRNWCLDKLVREGEWFWMLDDNITGFYALNETHARLERQPMDRFPMAFWHRVYRRKVAWPRMEAVGLECVAKADAIGAALVGFAVIDSPLFNRVKWKTWAYVSTKAALIKKTALRFEPELTAKVDHAFTAENLAAFGKVLVYNYAFPLGRHFMPGGIGNRDIRLEHQRFGCEFILRKYPGMWRWNNQKKGHPLNSEIVLNSQK